MEMTSPENDAGSAGPERLAREIITSYLDHRVYLAETANHLIKAATKGPDLDTRSSKVIFRGLVEPLADCFEPWAVSLYNRFFAQAVHFCRALSPDLDRDLASLGINDEQSLCRRVELLRPQQPTDTQPVVKSILRQGPDTGGGLDLKRVIVLSRVTLGADVAVTSVLMARLREAFPTAEMVLVGGQKMRELFGGDDRLRFHVAEYGRQASLLDRLLSWIAILGSVRSLTRGLKSSEYLVVDPDTRLTQLGMLPVCPDESYLFFPSREYRSSSDESLAALASHWSSEVFGGSDIQILPRLWLKDEDEETGRHVASRLGSNGKRKIVCLNFGVGGNQEKRAGRDFEQSLIDFLVAPPGEPRARPAVILDTGTGSEDKGLVDWTLKRAQASLHGRKEFKLAEACEDNLSVLLSSQDAPPDILVWRGRVGLLAAMIKASDAYIGYDSMGQHIAAALGTPCIDVAAGFPSPKFIRRWKPSGPGRVTLIEAPGAKPSHEVLAEVAGSLAPILGASTAR
jgi:hypothetical protein